MNSAGFDVEASDYFLLSSSAEAKGLFLYPITVGSLSYLPGYSLRHRRVDNFMIAYIRSGELNVRIAGEGRLVRTGQFLFMDCSMPHDFWTTMPCSDYFLHFNGPTAAGYHQYVTRDAGMVLTSPNPERVTARMRAIMDAAAGSTIVPPPLMSHMIDGMLADLATMNDQTTARTPTQLAVDRAVSYAAEHLDQDLSIDVLASVACMSRFHFAKTFKTVMGSSPNDFVTELRVEHAKYLLSLTDIPVMGIGRACGYRDQGTFGAMFRRRTGVSPSRYRMLHQSPAENEKARIPQSSPRNPIQRQCDKPSNVLYS